MRRAAVRRSLQPAWSRAAALLLAAPAALPFGAHAQEDVATLAQLDVNAVAQSEAGQRKTRPPRLSLTSPRPLPGDGPGVNLGLTWRQPISGDQAVDITAWRRVGSPDAISLIRQREPAYGARVEMRIPQRRTSFATDFKFIGLQLDSGARIGIRRKDGSPTLYYRSQF